MKSRWDPSILSRWSGSATHMQARSTTESGKAEKHHFQGIIFSTFEKLILITKIRAKDYKVEGNEGQTNYMTCFENSAEFPEIWDGEFLIDFETFKTVFCR